MSALVISSVKPAAATTPDFSISANPMNVVVSPGPQGNSTITLSSQQGFAGRVNMTVNVSPHGLYCQLNDMSLNVTMNGSNSTTLHCDGFPGTFKATVSGNATIASLTISHQVIVSYVVTDFSVSANPSSIIVQAGHIGSTSVTISSEQAFNQNIYLNLTLPPGINGSIFPSVLPGPGTATLNANSTAAGVYNLTIVVASGSISHKLSLEVTVTNPPPSTMSEGTILGVHPLVFYTALAGLTVIGFTGVILSLRHKRQTRKPEESAQGSSRKGSKSNLFSGSERGTSWKRRLIDHRIGMIPS